MSVVRQFLVKCWTSELVSELWDNETSLVLKRSSLKAVVFPEFSNCQEMGGRDCRVCGPEKSNWRAHQN